MNQNNIVNIIADIFTNPDIDLHRINELEAMSEPRSKYIIAITPRSGSSYLCDVMRRTRRFGMPYEAFNQIAYYIKRHSIHARSPEEYIRNVIRSGKTRNGVSGLKADWFRFDGFVQSMSDRTYLKGFKYIYLTRRDKFLQAISLYMATATQVWHSNTQTDANMLRRLETLEYNFPEINTWYQRINLQEQGWQKYFMENDISPLSITYEEIDADILNSLKRIAIFIGVKPKRILMPEELSVFTKVSDSRNMEWASRFESELDFEKSNNLRLEHPQTVGFGEKSSGVYDVRDASLLSNAHIGQKIKAIGDRAWSLLKNSRLGSTKREAKTNFHLFKVRAIESFIRFSEGRELPHRPLTMMVEVSNLCDLQCAMCVTFSAINPARTQIIKSKKREFFDTREISKLGQYLESALQVHAFGYGEPMIHPDFLKILDTLKSYEVMVDFFTNGMHLSEQNCRAIVDSGVAAITVSFSGTTKEEYEQVYLKGDFNIVLDGIRRLASYKRQCATPYPRIEINSLGFQHHVKKLPEFVRMMSEAGVNVIYLKPLHVAFTPFLEPFVAAYRPGIEGKIIEEAMVVAKKLGVHLSVEVFKRYTISDEANVTDFVRSKRGPLGDRIKKRFPELQLTSVFEIKQLAADLKQKGAFVKKNRPRDEQRAKPELMEMKQHNLMTPCFEPFKTVFIHVNGDIRPCCFAELQSATIGNVFDDGINVWGNAPFTQIQKGALNGQYPKMCDYCISVNNAPTNHGIKSVVAQYQEWYQHVYGVPFPVDGTVCASKLPDNAGIVEAWKVK